MSKVDQSLVVFSKGQAGIVNYKLLLLLFFNCSIIITNCFIFVTGNGDSTEKTECGITSALLISNIVIRFFRKDNSL